MTEIVPDVILVIDRNRICPFGTPTPGIVSVRRPDPDGNVAAGTRVDCDSAVPRLTVGAPVPSKVTCTIDTPSGNLAYTLPEWSNTAAEFSVVDAVRENGAGKFIGVVTRPPPG